MLRSGKFHILFWRLNWVSASTAGGDRCGKFEWNFRYVIFKWIWVIYCEIALIWSPLDFFDDQSTLVQVMALCRQATRHYLSQCWPRSTGISPYMVSLGHNELIVFAFVDNNVCRNVMTFRDKWHVNTQISLLTSYSIYMIYTNYICLMTTHIDTFRAKQHVDTQNPLSTRALVNRLVSQMRAPLEACREPAGKLWQLCKVLYVFWK